MKKSKKSIAQNFLISLLLSLSIFSCQKKPENSIQKAKKLIYEEKFEQANFYLDEEIKKSPQNLEFRYLYGWTFLQLGNQSQALRQFAKCINQDPSFYGGHKGLGAIFLTQGNFSKAEEEFQKALQDNKNQSEIYSNLSKVKSLQSKQQEAIEMLVKATQLEKTYGDYDYLLAKLYLDKKELSLANKALKDAQGKPFLKPLHEIQMNCLKAIAIRLEIESSKKKSLTESERTQLNKAKDLLNSCEKGNPARFENHEERIKISKLLKRK